MGSVFRYIADSALDAHRITDVVCPICGQVGDVFRAYADAVIPGEGSVDISEACANCIRHFERDWVSPLDNEKRLPAFFKAIPGLSKEEVRARLDAIILELRRTPRLPCFIQFDDWPFCCGDVVEYTGEPSKTEAEMLDRDGQYWNRGPATFHDRAADLVPSEGMAVLGGVSAFQCPRCCKRYWTFQCT
jgi:hypothetical protein